MRVDTRSCSLPRGRAVRPVRGAPVRCRPRRLRGMGGNCGGHPVHCLGEHLLRAGEVDPGVPDAAPPERAPCGERDPAPLDQDLSRVLAQAHTSQVQPRKVGRLRDPVTHPGQPFGEEFGQQRPVRGDVRVDGVEPGRVRAVCGRVPDHAEVAAAVRDGVRQPLQLGTARRTTDDQARLEASEVECLGRRGDHEAVVGDREPRHECRTLRDQRRMHLVDDHQGASTLRGLRDGRELLGGVDDPGRVVRAAQEQDRAPGRGIGRVRGQGRIDRGHVQAALVREGDRHHLATCLPAERREGRIDRTRDHDCAPGRAEPLDQDPDPGHDIRAQAHVTRVRVPVPSREGELGQGLLVRGPEVRVPGVARPHGLGQGLDHLGRGQHVHLGDPHRQDVRLVVLPLDRRAPT